METNPAEIWEIHFLWSQKTTETGASEIKNQISTIIPSGFVLDAGTDVEINSRDFEVPGFEGNGYARMLILDNTGDSNSEVQILVDGKVIRAVHVLNSNAAACSVPVPSVVTIRGADSIIGDPKTYACHISGQKANYL